MQYLRMHFFRCKLRRVIEERLLRNAFTLPALVGELLHVGYRSVQPLKSKYPANHDFVAADEYGSDAPRCQGLRLRQNTAFVCCVRIAADARRGLILLHRSIRGVEIFNGLYV